MSKANSLVQSDALVLFGATGDLAHKMIFPALYAAVHRLMALGRGAILPLLSKYLAETAAEVLVELKSPLRELFADAALFTREDAVETVWTVVAPVLQTPSQMVVMSPAHKFIVEI